MYLTVSIGNTDNRLTQLEWSDFVTDMQIYLEKVGKIHFMGAPPNWEQWQNVAWIIEAQDAPISIMAGISKIREKYKQDSAFVMVSDGEFI